MLRRVLPRNVVRPSFVSLSQRNLATATVASVTKSLESTTSFTKEAIARAASDLSAMGYDKSYEAHFNADQITSHVRGYLNALSQHVDASAPLVYSSETADGAFYLTGRGSNEYKLAKGLDHYISQNAKKGTHSISVESYSPTTDSGVTLTTVNFHPFIKAHGGAAADIQGLEPKPVLERLSTQNFIDTRSDNAEKRYATLLQKLATDFHQVYDIQQAEDGSLMLTIALQPDREVYFALLTSLVNRIPNVTITKRFLETFANGAQIYTFYTKGTSAEELERAALVINQLPNRPKNVLSRLHSEGVLSPNELIYGYSAMMFAYYYTPPSHNEDYKELAAQLTDENQVKRLKSLRSALFQEIMSESFIAELISNNIGLFKQLYNDFEKGSTNESRAAILSAIDKEKLPPAEDSFFRTVVNFNKAVVKTNFFKVKKAAVAYRLDPQAFMPLLEYPRVPHGIFMVLGSRFRGFHVRFHDIARGGIRMILSANDAVYKKNKRSVFNENYNLAHTQMLKNKDIPESGSKGTILVSNRLNFTTKAEAELAKKNIFLQYIDAMLDVMLPGVDGVRDNMGKREVLFFGPDENTAGDYPVFAAYLARDRGYAQWKSLTTGKGPVVGGVPHDTHGMTTRSVRQYVTGLYRKLNLQEETLTKFVTGGPDGDLGSNEILMGNEKIVAICDGEASVHDPAGIDRAELVRLAKARQTLKHLDASKLTKHGFKVLVEDTNVTLPDGTVVESGRAFRDSFHFTKYSRADIFVPCGGRPAAVTLATVQNFLVDLPDVTGEQMLKGRPVAPEKLKYKYIVEGANLFITQDARLALEAAGVHLFKDSSANKGGVTSSSIEVFTGLALDDATHKRIMCQQPDGSLPAFYQTMVKQIAARIEENARREFEIIWRDSQAGYLKGTKSLISDALSRKIVEIREFIAASDLHTDTQLFRHVIKKYTPPALLAEVGIDQIMSRVPENYLRAILEISIASEFVYTAGMKSNEFSFYEYMKNLRAEM